MTIYKNIQLNKKIPEHEDYKDNVIKNEFNEEAVEVSSDYWEVPPLNSKEALIKFPCEEKEDYKFRKTATSPTNFMSTILNKYLSTCFKEKVVRTENEFNDDVDTLGSTIDEFFKMATKYSLIDGVSYILPDSTAQETTLSEAQKEQLGIRPFLRFIECDNVINWSDALGHLQEALVEFQDEEGKPFFIYYDTVNYAKIEVDPKTYIVKSIDGLAPHGFSTIPVTRIMPFDTEESFVSAGANLQLSINNLNSLLKTELFRSTFTRYFISGIQLPNDPEGNPLPLSWGNDRLMVSPNADSKIQPLGAQVDQADSIRSSIKDETTNLFKQYNLSATSIGEMNQVPSGLSLIVSREDMNSVCSTIVKEVERAEAKIVMLLNEMESLNLEAGVYSRVFVQPDEQEDITKLRDLLALDLPPEAKDIAKQRFIKKYLSQE